MQGFISTDTVILVTLLCKNMPNLLYYIVHDSASKKQKKELALTAAPKKLSAKQIYEASMHSNSIIRQALSAIAKIQSAINTVEHKIDNMVEQRALIENTLLKILSTTSEE